MKITRRRFIELSALALPLSAANGQTPAPIRAPLSDFMRDDAKMATLRRGVTEMKKRKPSDPLSWFFQASIHGVTNLMINEARKEDSNLTSSLSKYWNQCHHAKQYTANFLPWHRAYTTHFEAILRHHIGDESFALPYWDFSHYSLKDWDTTKPDRAKFPKAFGLKQINGVENPLFMMERNFFFCHYGVPFDDIYPVTELSAEAIDTSVAMAAKSFFSDENSIGFGGSLIESKRHARGLLEKCPHDNLHQAIGGKVQGIDKDNKAITTIGALTTPTLAGFDPIFHFLHTAIDRLWVKWMIMPEKTWGNIPNMAWFDEKPWVFFGADGKEVNLTRRNYFDDKSMAIRYDDIDPASPTLKIG